ARLAGYLGVFVLALSIQGRRSVRLLLAALASAIVLISTLALLSRLHPAWFPTPEQLLQALPGSPERLSYPINYWNGLAGLIAIGTPLVLQFAAYARSAYARAAAAAALPIFGLTLFFTLSRAGIAAAVIAVIAFVALTTDRLRVAASIAIAATGSAILI